MKSATPGWVWCPGGGSAESKSVWLKLTSSAIRVPSFRIFLIYRQAGGGFALVLAHGIAFELYLIGVVEQPVAYGISQGGVADIRMPVTDGALAGNDGGARLLAVFHDLQQVPSLLVGGRGEQKIIDNQ